MAMFRSLLVAHSDTPFAATLHLSPEAPALVGFMCGNTHHAGCLTLDETVRIHSCEKGSYCQTIQNSPVVWIRPIITRLPGGQDVAEAGIGGGGEDLEREAELDYLSPLDVEDFLEAYLYPSPFPQYGLTLRVGSLTPMVLQTPSMNKSVGSLSAP